VLSPTDTIEPEVLAMSFQDTAHPAGHHPALAYVRLPYHESMDAHSRFLIDQALREAEGNQTKAAERLGLQRTYLARLIKQKKVRPDDEAEE
jgi:DNA-binding NtrC family response regulator